MRLNFVPSLLPNLLENVPLGQPFDLAKKLLLTLDSKALILSLCCGEAIAVNLVYPLAKKIS